MFLQGFKAQRSRAFLGSPIVHRLLSPRPCCICAMSHQTVASTWDTSQEIRESTSEKEHHEDLEQQSTIATPAIPSPAVDDIPDGGLAAWSTVLGA